MHQQLAGRQPHDLIRRHATVGAPDPQVLRRLLARQARKELGILPSHLRCPGAVIRE